MKDMDSRCGVVRAPTCKGTDWKCFGFLALQQSECFTRNLSQRVHPEVGVWAGKLRDVEPQTVLHERFHRDGEECLFSGDPGKKGEN